MAALEEPDKGYAWVVLLCACIINMILTGMARMIGLLYVAIIDAYGVTRKEASVPFSVRQAVRAMAGPLAGALAQTYGIRAVTFWGGLIAAAGSILSAFAPTVEWIVFWWGIVHGLGFAHATLFHVVINQYFEKHRASASGIVLSGACFAALIFPLMIDAMLSAYGIFGCFLLLGGLFLNVLPPSLVLKMPPWVEFPEAYARKRSLLSKLSKNEKEDKGPSLSEFHHVKSNNILTEKNRLYDSVPNSTLKIKGFNFQPNDTCCQQANIVCKFYHPMNSNELQTKKDVTKFQQDDICCQQTDVVCKLYLPMDPDELQTNRNLTKFQPDDICCQQTDVVCKLYLPMDPDELQTNINLTKFQNGIANPAFIPDSEIHYRQTGQKNSSQSKPAQQKQEHGFIKNLQKIPHLYRNPVYNLISLSIAVYLAVFIPVLTVIVDYTRDKGIPRNCEQFLIHSLTVGDLIGRLGFGWVTDRKYLSFANFMMISFAAKGVFVALFPLCRSLPTYIVVVGLYGVTSGTVCTYIPVLVHKYVEKDRQPIAIGCVGLFSSIATFGIPTLIGYFRDCVGSYDGLFYILAALSMVPGGLWLMVSLCQTLQDRKSRANA